MGPDSLLNRVLHLAGWLPLTAAELANLLGGDTGERAAVLKAIRDGLEFGWLAESDPDEPRPSLSRVRFALTDDGRAATSLLSPPAMLQDDLVRLYTLGQALPPERGDRERLLLAVWEALTPDTRRRLLRRKVRVLDADEPPVEEPEPLGLKQAQQRDERLAWVLWACSWGHPATQAELSEALEMSHRAVRMAVRMGRREGWLHKQPRFAARGPNYAGNPEPDGEGWAITEAGRVELDRLHDAYVRGQAEVARRLYDVFVRAEAEPDLGDLLALAGPSRTTLDEHLDDETSLGEDLDAVVDITPGLFPHPRQLAEALDAEERRLLLALAWVTPLGGRAASVMSSLLALDAADDRYVVDAVSRLSRLGLLTTSDNPETPRRLLATPRGLNVARLVVASGAGEFDNFDADLAEVAERLLGSLSDEQWNTLVEASQAVREREVPWPWPVAPRGEE